MELYYIYKIEISSTNPYNVFTVISIKRKFLEIEYTVFSQRLGGFLNGLEKTLLLLIKWVGNFGSW